MDSRLQALLAELENFGRVNDASATDRSRRLLNITRETGLFLSFLVRATRARRVLEIGTSNGYSTLWLGEAASSVGGSVVTVERSEAKIEMAKATFARSGLAEVIRLVHDDGGRFLSSAGDAAFDLIFLDSERSEYVGWWANIERVLRRGGVLVADNATSHARELGAFMDLVSFLSEFVSLVLPVGNGEFVATHSTPARYCPGKRSAPAHMATRFFAPVPSRLRVMRDGQSIVRRAHIPKPVVLVDTREQDPFPLHANHPNWIGGERRVALKTGDYSVEGMESLLCLERKSLADLVACTVSDRRRFLAVCGRLAGFTWKAILVEATLEDIKGGFESFDIPSEVHPNAVCGALDAIEAKLGIPVIYTSTLRDLATERAASWLSKHFTYWWLEQHGYGRVLIDSDEL